MTRKFFAGCFLWCAVLCLLAQPALASKNSITCTGGMLHIELTLPDGTQECFDTKLTCSGEWTYSWEAIAVSDPSKSGGTSMLRFSRDPERSQAVAALGNIRTSDLTLLYKAPAPIVKAFKERAGWPTVDQGLIVLPTGTGPTFPTEPFESFKDKSYPPHGYPCLGCHPCPPPEGSYCDNGNKAMGPADLAPEFAAQGYRVVGGRITKGLRRTVGPAVLTGPSPDEPRVVQPPPNQDRGN